MIDTRLLFAFACGVFLTLLWTLIDRHRHRRSDRDLLRRLQEIAGSEAEDLASVGGALEQIVHDAGEQVRTHHPHDRSEPWTMKAWSAEWLQLLRDRGLPPIATAKALLASAGDQRDLGTFVQDTLGLQKRLHRLLLGSETVAPIGWTQAVAQLEEATSTPAEMDTLGEGLMRERQRLQEDRANLLNELAATRDSLTRAQRTADAVSSLLTSCGIKRDADTADIAGAAEGIGLLLIVARAETGVNGEMDWNLAPALEQRLRELRRGAEECEQRLADADRQLRAAQQEISECTRARDAAMAVRDRYQGAAVRLMAQLELPSPGARAVSDGDGAIDVDLFLHGDCWTLRLLLLTAKHAWPSAAHAIAPELSAFARSGDVPAHCRAAIGTLERIAVLDSEPLQGIALDDVEALCRLYDVTSRIGELHGAYAIDALDPVEPWARCVATAIRAFLAARHVELRRPPLLLPPGADCAGFDTNFDNDPIPSIHTIQQRISSKLTRGNDGFVVDVTQSEVVVSGVVRRIGVLSLVSPHRWRP